MPRDHGQSKPLPFLVTSNLSLSAPVPLFSTTKSTLTLVHQFAKWKSGDPGLWISTTENQEFLKRVGYQTQSLKKYKMESSDSGATWAIWLSTHVDSKTQLTPKSNNVNRQKLTHSAWAYFVSYEIWRGIKCTPATLAEAFFGHFCFHFDICISLFDSTFRSFKSGVNICTQWCYQGLESTLSVMKYGMK